MRTFIALSSALLLTAAPAAHAQLLGGGLGGLGGLGGTLNGSIGGTLGGAGSVGGTLDSVHSKTSGTLRGAASSSGKHTLDRKSGQAKVERNAAASGEGGITSSLAGPVTSLTSSGSANASGSAGAQLIGTDAVRETVQSGRGTARAAGSQAAGHGKDAAARASGNGQGLLSGATGGLGGALSGSGRASAAGSAGGASGPFDSAADVSGAGEGVFTVTSGMPVLSPEGQRIGRVRRVISNSRGEAEQLLVKVDGQLATLPAANFSASGNAVMSAMSEGQIKQVGNQQEDAKAAKPAGGAK